MYPPSTNEVASGYSHCRLWGLGPRGGFSCLTVALPLCLSYSNTICFSVTQNQTVMKSGYKSDVLKLQEGTIANLFNSCTSKQTRTDKLKKNKTNCYSSTCTLLKWMFTYYITISVKKLISIYTFKKSEVN